MDTSNAAKKKKKKGKKTKGKVNFLYRKRLNTVILPCD